MAPDRSTDVLWPWRIATTDTLLESLRALGIPVEDFDDFIPAIDNDLCGATDEALDAVYPPNDRDVRMLLTDPFRNVPALRLAFKVEASRHVAYLGADLR